MAQFIASEKIRVYNTPYRTRNKAKTVQFDPESRLYTEEAVRRIYETFNTYNDDQVTTSKGSFIITDDATWQKSKQAKIEFFIAGYYVCIDNPSFKSHPVYANICISGTDVVSNWRDYHLSYISSVSGTEISADYNSTDFDDSASDSHYFHGIVFTDVPMTTTKESKGTVYSLQLTNADQSICKNNLLKFDSANIFGGKDYDSLTWSKTTNKSLEELLATEKTYTSEIRGYKLNPLYNAQSPESKANQKFIQSDIKISADNNKINLIGKAGITETNGFLYKETIGKVVTYYAGDDNTGTEYLQWNANPESKLLKSNNIKDIELNGKTKFSINDKYLINIADINGTNNYLHLNITDLTTEKNINLGTNENRFGSLYLSSKSSDKVQIGTASQAAGDVDIFAKTIDTKGKSKFQNTTGAAYVEIGVNNEKQPSTEESKVKIAASAGIFLENDTTINGDTSITNHRLTITGKPDAQGIKDVLHVTGNSEFVGNVQITGNTNFIGALNTSDTITSKTKFRLLDATDGTTEDFSVVKDKLSFLGSSIEAKNAKAEFKSLTVNTSAAVTGIATFQNKVSISKDLTIQENLKMSDGKSLQFKSSKLTAGSDKKLSYDGNTFETKNINVTNGLTVANKIKTKDLEVTNAKTLYMHNIYIAGDINSDTGKGSWESNHEKFEEWETYTVERPEGDFNIGFSFINTYPNSYENDWNKLVDAIIAICGEKNPSFKSRQGFTWWDDESAKALSNGGNRLGLLPASGYAKDNKDLPVIHVSACWDKSSKNATTNDMAYIVALYETNGNTSLLSACFTREEDTHYCNGSSRHGQSQFSDTVYALKFF